MIDYKKAYDMVPHTWIMECLNLVGAAENVKKPPGKKYFGVENCLDLRK